jgi:ABC-type dipeptide/oligopeptide/nickel transport system permease component
VGFPLGGAVITETIFSWPGISRYAWKAPATSTSMSMGVTLVALAYALINWRWTCSIRPSIRASVCPE